MFYVDLDIAFASAESQEKWDAALARWNTEVSPRADWRLVGDETLVREWRRIKDDVLAVPFGDAWPEGLRDRYDRIGHQIDRAIDDQIDRVLRGDHPVVTGDPDDRKYGVGRRSARRRKR